MVEKKNSDQLDILDMLAFFWQKKVWLISVGLLAALMGVVYALSQPNIYRAEALLSPVKDDQAMGAGISGQLGGLASLAGFNVANKGVDKIDVGLEVLKSRQFFSDFVDRHDILVNLMAVESWSLDNNQLVIDDSKYDQKSASWVRPIEPPRGATPTIQEAHEVFLKHLHIDEEKSSGFVTLAVEHISPYVAKQWVDWLVQDINNTIRQQEVARAERSISYLKEQIEQTSVAALQAGFFELVQAQTETIMLAKASPEFLFRTIDPAVVPELKVGPKRALIVILAGIIGGLLAITVLVFVYIFRVSPRRSENS